MSNQPSVANPLRRPVLVSAISLGIGFGYSQMIRFASSVILAKLLIPEAFGLMALVSTLMVGLQLFSDLGIRSSVIHNSKGDEPEFLNTAWTMQILRGFLLWFGACLLAWPAAYWRADPAPDLLWLAPLIGLTAIFDGFTSTKLFTLSRHISQGREVIIEVIAQTSGVATTITWALNDPSIRALAAGQLLNSFLKMSLTHLLLPGMNNRLCWNRAALSDLAHFAKWVYLGTMFTFVAQYADRIVVGLDSIKELGVYHFARQLADIPAELMLALSGKLIFPVYSRQLRSGLELQTIFPRVHLLAGGISALLLAGVLATGPTLIHCLYDQRYQDAAWILPLLAIGSWFRMLESNAGTVFFAKGLVRYSAYSNAAKATSLLLFMPVGYHLDGLRGLILGFVAGDVVRYAWTVRFLLREGYSILRIDLFWSLFIALSAFGASEFGRQVWLIPTNESAGRLIYLPRLILQGGFVIVCWGLVVLACRRKGYFQKPPTAALAT